MTTREDNLKVLIEGIQEVKGEDLSFPVTEETKLRDLNLDSLDIVELQMFYEEKMNVVIKDPEGPITKVSELLDLM